MKFWIDTEFNEYQGQLISLALVGEDGSEWYEALHCENPGPWVMKHVMPIINKQPLSEKAFSLSLRAFLNEFDDIHIIADWPEDIAYFCNAIVVGPGIAIDTPPLTFEINRNLPDTAEISALPHNALEDARALRNVQA